MSEAQAEARNVYRLQMMGDRLCSALRRIVDLSEEGTEIHTVALKALKQKTPNDLSQMETE